MQERVQLFPGERVEPAIQRPAFSLPCRESSVPRHLVRRPGQVQRQWPERAQRWTTPVAIWVLGSAQVLELATALERAAALELELESEWGQALEWGLASALELELEWG